MVGLPYRTRPDLVDVGALATAPTAGSVDAVLKKDRGDIYRLDFTFRRARLPVTDGTTSGSYGSLKIFDFNEGAISFLGTRQDYTAFAEGSALTGGAGDAAFVLGIGSAAIAAAADGTLTTTQQDIGTKTATITLSGGTGSGTLVDGAKTTALNGTATGVDLYLNFSGTAATIDANSYLDVTGTVSVSFVWLGDD
ncbi:hypothetical protein [Kaistia sp. MMO-174]|uniref:hypothetical protein n=1 Tax=Kaistia sp. MMO-174 TaxID=3081256 RepID=UPI003018B37D